MNYLFYTRILFLCLFLHLGIRAQISIVNISVQPFNLTAESLLNVNIMNGGGENQAQTITQLINAQGIALLTVKSQVFTLKSGLNSGSSATRKIASSEFHSSSQASYLKTTHNLSSGRYKVCSTVLLQNGSNEVDDLCEELEADFNQYLYLVNPFDGDTVDSKNPLLLWTHSEPFSILGQGEFYRMIVSEIKAGQSADEAITVNSPVMVKNYLKEHQLQYPFDAKELKEGSVYAWQVQKLSDGVVINKTEAWVFNMRKLEELKSLKYVVPKRQLDGSFYNAFDGLVYFKFSEEYRSGGQLKFFLTDSKSKQLEVEITKDRPVNTKKEGADSELKTTGNNLYELNLNAKKLSPGFYTLEIKNEKNESFYLKLFLP